MATSRKCKQAFVSFGLLLLQSFCFIFLWSELCVGKAEPKATILSKASKVGDRVFPKGTKVIYNKKQEPIEALISTSINWDKIYLPTGTRVIFKQKSTEWLIIPNGISAIINGKSISGTIVQIASFFGSDSMVKPLWETECLDSSDSWLSPSALLGGISGLTWNDFNNTQGLKPVSTSELTGAVEPTNDPTKRLMVLKKTFSTSQVEIPEGSILATSDDGLRITHFYSLKKARIGRYIIPERSLVIMDPGWLSALVQDEFKVRQFLINSGSYLTLNHKLEINFLQIARKANLMETTFSVPAKSLISFEKGRPWYVKVGEPAFFKGLPVSSQRYICFSVSGFTNLPLAKDSTVGTKIFPAGSFVIVNNDGFIVAVHLSKPSSFDGIMFSTLSGVHDTKSVSFHLNGKVSSGYLNTSTLIDGIKVAGYIRFFDNGKIAAAILDGDQKITGIPCMGGKYVYFNKAGKLLSFTAASRYQIGSSVLERGTHFNGIVKIDAKTTLLDSASLNAALTGLQSQIIEEISNEMNKHAGKFPYGRIKPITGHNYRISYAIDNVVLHQEADVPDMLTNPPFADCDGKISTDIELRWAITKSNRPTFRAWVSSMKGEVTYGFCPGTKFLDMAGSFLDFLGFIKLKFEPVIPENLQYIKEIDEGTSGEIKKFLQAAYPDATVIEDSFKPLSVFIEQNQLKLSYKYEIELK